jgi:hypothetical protein
MLEAKNTPAKAGEEESYCLNANLMITQIRGCANVSVTESGIEEACPTLNILSKSVIEIQKRS